MKVNEMTPARMLALMNHHAGCEYERDLDGVMATVSGEPMWEFHPLGLRIEGRAAVQEMYEHLLDGLLPFIVGSAPRVVGYDDGILIREASYRIRHPDGGEVTGQSAIVFEFASDGLLLSERVYASGALVNLVESCFPESFRSRPGVIRTGG